MYFVTKSESENVDNVVMIFKLVTNREHLPHGYIQGCSLSFESGGAKAHKIILDPFCFKKWRGPTFALVLAKNWGARALPAHSKTTPLQFKR